MQKIKIENFTTRRFCMWVCVSVLHGRGYVCPTLENSMYVCVYASYMEGCMYVYVYVCHTFTSIEHTHACIPTLIPGLFLIEKRSW